MLTVRASLEDAAAYLFDYRSRANRAFGDFKRTAVKQKKNGEFELLVSRSVMLEGTYWNSQQECQFSSILKLHRVDEDNIVVLTDPAKLVGGRRSRKIFTFRLSKLGKTEGSERSAVRLTRMSAMETRVEAMTALNFGTPIGRAMAKKEVKRELGGYKAMTSYFLNLLSGDRLHEVNEKDGITLGELIYEGERDTVKETISNCAVLNSLQVEFPWFEAMMEEVLKNKLRPATAAIATKAECLSIAEAKKIGGSLSISLATNTTAAAGVDE